MKRSECLSAIDEIHGIWQKQPLTEKGVETYVRYLDDLSFDALMLAIMELANTEEYLPSIAKLRSATVALIPGNKIPTADEAWRELPNELRRVGLRRSEELQPVFSHPAILEAADSLSWEALVYYEKPAILQSQFAKIYETIAERYRREQLKSPRLKELQTRVENSQIESGNS